MVAHGVSRGLSGTGMTQARRATHRSIFGFLRCVALRAVSAGSLSPTARAVGYHLPPSGLVIQARFQLRNTPVSVVG